MAFSQVQCLDDNHVNWRSSESKPEFFYSEEQRLALEALVARGRDAFYEVLKRENIRDFLSELELSRIVEAIEVYDPGSEDPRVSGRRPEPQDNGGADASEETSAAGGPPATETLPSLEYWPQKSDRSIPQLDLGWPDTIAYRGVTRASVYMQPPIDGQPHIKEVVRKMVSQAQKPGLTNGDPEKLCFLPRATQQEERGAKFHDARLTPHLSCQIPAFTLWSPGLPLGSWRIKAA